MIFVYFATFAMLLFAIGLAGAASSKNFIIIILSLEVSITAATLLALGLFYFVDPNDILIFLLTVWSVISVEVMALVALYRYMTKHSMSLDISKLSDLKER
jgi:NADH:ubiquinone oxidoreductase subunit K